jgi:hypothetical protein
MHETRGGGTERAALTRRPRALNQGPSRHPQCDVPAQGLRLVPFGVAQPP